MREIHIDSDTGEVLREKDGPDHDRFEDVLEDGVIRLKEGEVALPDGAISHVEIDEDGNMTPIPVSDVPDPRDEALARFKEARADGDVDGALDALEDYIDPPEPDHVTEIRERRREKGSGG